MLFYVCRVNGFRPLRLRPRFIDFAQEHHVGSIASAGLVNETLDRPRPCLHASIVFE